jgi:hypothetical protein
MNRLQKAEAFGHMMGKRALLIKSADAAFFPKQTKDYPGSTADINRRSAELQAKWAPANAANNLRLQNNEKQRFAGLTPEAQNAERQTKRDAYDSNINQQLSQGHGIQSTQADFANIIPAAQAASWLGKGLYSGANRLASAAIRSPIAPSYIRNTFNPGYPVVRKGLANTTKFYGSSSGLGEPIPANAKGAYIFGNDQAHALGLKGTVEGKNVMRHELTHGVNSNTVPEVMFRSGGKTYYYDPKVRNVAPRSLHTDASKSVFLDELNAHAASSRTPIGQMLRGLDFATSPNAVLGYAGKYTPREMALHGTLAGTRLAGYGEAIRRGTNAVMSHLNPTTSSYAVPNPYTENGRRLLETNEANK